jgi:hypothetical protein
VDILDGVLSSSQISTYDIVNGSSCTSIFLFHLPLFPHLLQSYLLLQLFRVSLLPSVPIILVIPTNNIIHTIFSLSRFLTFSLSHCYVHFHFSVSLSLSLSLSFLALTYSSFHSTLFFAFFDFTMIFLFLLSMTIVLHLLM